MKGLKTLFAMILVVGTIGLSQAFACKPPTGNLPAQGRPSESQPTVRPEPANISYEPEFTSYSKKDLVGRYASLATATFFDPGANRTLYATCVGVVTFDGRGHFTDREVHSYDGVIVRDEFTGTYTLSPDGRGTMHFVGDSETFDYEFVVSNDTKEITFLITLEIPGVVSNGTLKKQ